ncbi:MAG: hypothetical protein K1Y36_13630 [Blastocatellia bacterium]|nr:hypothetical protein [Blastocatellia bacterium]
MTKERAGTFLLGYGGFLIALGVIGFLSNPAKAASALIAGGVCGILAIVFGLQAQKGHPKSIGRALGMVMVTVFAFGWRAVMGWMSVVSGNNTKLLAASLITTMLAGSLAMLPVLFKANTNPNEKF